MEEIMPFNIYELPIPAELIFEVLIDICGASTQIKDDFIFRHQPENLLSFPDAYRFAGKLGLGGKFCISNRMHDRWYVECYSEDVTEERSVMITKANKKLEMIRQYFLKINNIYKNSQKK